ncbi:MAG: metallophosphoesterase family protein [Candidatus Cyclobacteriaceae bacterium M2_1C_046]
MIKIGIISDIHSHRWDNKTIYQGGYYYPNMPEKPVSQNPFASLKKLIRQEKSEYDYILCPGDFAHQIDPDGLKSSWDQLKLIKNEVKACMLIATIGNHDVASRGNGDVFRYIKNFDNDFPVYSSGNSAEYKSQLLDKGYYKIEDEKLDILIVVINSCFDHWDHVEASKGKIETEHLDDLKDIIQKSPRNIKLGLVHHHPVIHETGIYDTSDLIEGSEGLMKSLSGLDLIIHGHKHDYRFTQKKVFPKNLNILSSGSFSCFKTHLKTGTVNYFHEIEFHSEHVSHCEKQGIIKTYGYDPTSGWNRYKELDEGFGCIFDIQNLFSFLKEEILKLTEVNYLEWYELIEKYPLLKYISRESRNASLNRLKDEGVIMRYNKNQEGIGDIIIR